MASISSVVTRGFGPPGSASLVVTAGYGIGAAVLASGTVRSGHTLRIRAGGRHLAIQPDERRLAAQPDARRITVH